MILLFPEFTLLLLSFSHSLFLFQAKIFIIRLSGATKTSQENLVEFFVKIVETNYLLKSKKKSHSNGE